MRETRWAELLCRHFVWLTTVACLAGYVYAYTAGRAGTPIMKWRLPALVFLAFDTYLIASWWDWQFGASYGHRGFVDIYPLFAIGLASLFARIAARPRIRWSGMHAAFFVPSNAGVVRIPVATTFDEHGRDPMIVTFWIDDIRATRILLADAEWHDVELTVPHRRWRRFVRIDVRTSVARADDYGVKLGDISCCSASPGSTR